VDGPLKISDKKSWKRAFFKLRRRPVPTVKKYFFHHPKLALQFDATCTHAQAQFFLLLLRLNAPVRQLAEMTHFCGLISTTFHLRRPARCADAP
jgi:hypothetical protein